MRIGTCRSRQWNWRAISKQAVPVGRDRVPRRLSSGPAPGSGSSTRCAWHAIDFRSRAFGLDRLQIFSWYENINVCLHPTELIRKQPNKMAKRQSVKAGSKSESSNDVKAPRGRLGVMIPGMGAVATTFVAGVEAVRKGLSKPIGSLTQMGTIRLGKRTDGRSPRIKEFVSLAALNDLVFTGWDIFEDDMYTAARKAGVLEKELLDEIKPFLSTIKPQKAVFDHNYVKKIDGPNVKKGRNKMDLAEQVRDDMRAFKKNSGASRLITMWCGSTESYIEPTGAHQSVKAFERALRENDEMIAPSMIYAY